MNNKILIIILFLCIILLSGCIKNENNKSKSIDMIIFISPQYSEDSNIRAAIDNYVHAVKEDINWNTRIIKITPNINNFKKIDDIIEDYYKKNEIKACIMVGEDIHTASGGDTEYMERPTTIPWSTIGGEEAYEIEYHFHPESNTEQVTPKSNYSVDIAISLIYPTHELNYQIKASQIVSVFKKFSENRDIVYPENIACFVSTQDTPIISGTPVNRQTYKILENYGDLYYKEDPNEADIYNSLNSSYKLYAVSGHSTPGVTMVKNDTCFYSDYVDTLDTPLFMASGCYVDGWYSYKDVETDNEILDYSRNESWYGSKIFNNPNLRVMVLGFPDKYTITDNVVSKKNFIVNSIPKLMKGKTIAESVIKQKYEDPSIITIYGDPTFHYN